MPMINLVMCHASNISERVGKKGIMSPLSLAYIAGHTPKHYSIKVFDEYVDNKFSPENIKADLVAISAITPGISRAYEIGDILRKRGIICVIGGVHASILPEEALSHFDAVITGEGEQPWQEFLHDFERGILKQIYTGRLDTPLDNIGVPRRDCINPNYVFQSLLTSRGCPHSCSFCYLSAFKDRKYRTLPHDIVLEDMESIKQKLFTIVDENFTGYSNQHFEDRKVLLEKIIKKNLHKFWGCQTTVNISTKPELMSLMYKAGCRVVFLGFESEEQDGLIDIRKKHNLSIDNKEAIRTLHKNGFAVIASYVFGLDSHGKDYYKKLIQGIKNSKPDFLRLTYLTAWPGTPLYNNLKDTDRIERDWDTMYVDKPSITFKNFSHGEVREARKMVLNSFYNTINITRIAIRCILRTNTQLVRLLFYMSFLWARKWNSIFYKGDPNR